MIAEKRIYEWDSLSNVFCINSEEGLFLSRLTVTATSRAVNGSGSVC